jgi:exosortase/archaeosortase family protein
VNRAKPKVVLLLLPLAWLWLRLSDHLRVEWTLNPQYSYGWVVPCLCAYLLWRRVKTHSAEGVAATGQNTRQNTQRPPSTLRSSLLCLLPGLGALAYLPTRLVQEANPEWRLVSWALALEVIAISMLLLYALSDEWQIRRAKHQDTVDVKNRNQPSGGDRPTAPSRPMASRRSAFGFQMSDLVFPLGFFLVAVPWPTLLEQPLIQALTRANVRTTIDLLALLGFPAMPQGNGIEVATGLVDINDACSGIRSIQATLMISLYLGEVYGLSVRRRVACVVTGFILAFLFNVGRTLLLAWVAATKGVAVVAAWHGPAGITLLVACFTTLWLITRRLRSSQSAVRRPHFEVGDHWPVVGGPSSVVRNAVPLIAFALIAWLLFAEVSTELWYRTHEWQLPGSVTWKVEFPRSNATYRDLPISDQARQCLRFDEGHSGAWQQGPDQHWQAIFFRWNPGRIAVHLAKSHTPEVCLTAAGRELISQSPLRTIRVQGLLLPFQSYLVKDEHGPLYVYYCLWEDRAVEPSPHTTAMTYATRLTPVLAGRRHSGQRSLELAISGITDPQAAEAALTRQLEQMLKVE